MTLRKYIIHLVEEEDVKNSKSSEDLRDRVERCKAYNRILKDPLLQSALDQKIDTEIKKYYNSPAGLLELIFDRGDLLSIKFKSDERHPLLVEIKTMISSLVNLHATISSDEWLLKRYPNSVEIIKDKLINWISNLAADRSVDINCLKDPIELFNREEREGY